MCLVSSSTEVYTGVPSLSGRFPRLGVQLMRQGTTRNMFDSVVHCIPYLELLGNPYARNPYFHKLCGIVHTIMGFGDPGDYHQPVTYVSPRGAWLSVVGTLMPSHTG